MVSQGAGRGGGRGRESKNNIESQVGRGSKNKICSPGARGLLQFSQFKKVNYTVYVYFHSKEIS
jgi:hypothetical protein